jgi:hypothetical protein
MDLLIPSHTSTISFVKHLAILAKATSISLFGNTWRTNFVCKNELVETDSFSAGRAFNINFSVGISEAFPYLRNSGNAVA